MRSGEISERQLRTKGEQSFYEPPFSKGGGRIASASRGGDLPLRDKVRLSESSVSKTPAAFLWGQTLPVYCAALSKPPPLAKGRHIVDRTI